MKFHHQLAAERNGRWICASLALGLVLLAPAGVEAAERTRTLLREGWFVKQLDSDQPDVAALTGELESPDHTWLAAQMPAQVHDVLLAHGRISDPRIGRNAAESAWVGDKDWAYGCRFPSPEIAGGPVWLRFGGLDTLAVAYLNGQRIGPFNNMYREYASDVRADLRLPACKTRCSWSSRRPCGLSKTQAASGAAGDTEHPLLAEMPQRFRFLSGSPSACGQSGRVSRCGRRCGRSGLARRRLGPNAADP